MYIGTFEAKNRFSELLDIIEKDGREIIVTRRGKAVAMISPVKKTKKMSHKEAIDSMIKFGKKNYDSFGLKNIEELKTMIEKGKK